MVNEKEASEVGRIQVIYVAALEQQDQLLLPNRKDREQKVQSQANPAVYQMSVATHHCQVNRESNEETYWKEVKLARSLVLTMTLHMQEPSSQWPCCLQ